MLYLYYTRVLFFFSYFYFYFSSLDIFDEFNTFTSIFFFNFLLVVTRYNSLVGSWLSCCLNHTPVLSGNGID